MKFLHISDLHLGKRVNEFSMMEDQKYILDRILAIAEEEQTDGVLVAGDIYDKAVPSAEAVQVFDRFLTGLVERGNKVFAVSGNHDSAERIAFGARLMQGRGVYFSPVYDGRIEKISLSDEYGELFVYLLPFIKPAVVRHVLEREQMEGQPKNSQEERKPPESGQEERKRSEGGQEERKRLESDQEKRKQSEGGQEERKRLESDQEKRKQSESGQEERKQPESYQEAVKLAVQRMRVNPEERSLLVAHQFVTGAGRCDSEEIVVGGLDNVDVEVFDRFDYVALGHIHSPQWVGRETVRYCGTPLKYSFSEAEQEKSVTVVEFKEKGRVELRTVPLKPLHDLRRIRGTYMEVMSKKFYQNTDTEDYVQITLTDEEDVPDGLQRLRSVYPNLMSLEYDNNRTRQSQAVEAVKDMERKSELELFGEFYELQNNQSMSGEQMEFVQHLVESLSENKRGII